MAFFKKKDKNNEAAVSYEEIRKQPVGKEQIKKANEILRKYKDGKQNLENKIVANEQWYKLHNWEQFDEKNQDQIKPRSAWLFNVCESKHADAMDNIPSPNILPREENDKDEAEKLSCIIPVVLKQNGFERVYSNVWRYKITKGTGVYEVIWDKNKLNGLGDIAIKKADILNLFWEPGITDIQDSRNFFHTELWDNEVLEELYPETKGKLTGTALDVKKYVYDDSVDTSKKSLVVDWYYKRYKNGKTVLHYCKYVNDIVLYATENDDEPVTAAEINPLTGEELTDGEGKPVKRVIREARSERGIYDHALFPYVFDPMFPIEGSPCGFGYIDIGKSAQEQIDRLNKCILENTYVNAKPRFFINDSGAVSEEEYADLNNDFVHVDGSLGENSILPIKSGYLNGTYIGVLNNKIEELKETTGNRDVSNGGTTSGTTAASAIAAMQEAGSKLSRDANKQAYGAFTEVVNLVIELIRQFYDVKRQFRITGKDGQERFESFSNEGLVPQPQGEDFNIDMGYRLPVFDIEVTAQKQSPYTKLSQNELALQLYSAGFFDPQRSDPALACLDMMDFDRKSFVMSKIQNNGTMFQQLQQMQEIVRRMTAEIQLLRGSALPEPTEPDSPEDTQAQERQPQNINSVKLGEQTREPGITRNARTRVAEATAPR